MTHPVAAPLSPKQIARQSGSSFLVSFAFLAPARRRALTAVYAFFRVIDDAVDETGDPATAREQLKFWEEELDQIYEGTATTELGHALQSAVRVHGIRKEHLREVMRGVERDLGTHHFADVGAMEGYCSQVASAVGLACLPVLGVSGPDAEHYADRLGKALQITNILRDLRSDAEIGRVYVPRDWLREEGVEIEWLKGKGPPEVYVEDGPIHRVVQRLVALAEERFGEAAASLPPDGKRRLLPARIMGGIYRDLLRKVRARKGDLRADTRLRVGNWRRCIVAVSVLLGFRR